MLCSRCLLFSYSTSLGNTGKEQNKISTSILAVCEFFLFYYFRMSEFQICEDCFYKHRTNVDFDSCPHGDKHVYCTWNVDRQTCETTAKSIRPLPEVSVRQFYMCNPLFCRGKECTYAHGKPELKNWNQLLRTRNKPGTRKPGSKRMRLSQEGKVVLGT